MSVFTTFFLLSFIGKVPILRPNLSVILVVQMPIRGPMYLEIEDHGCKSSIFTYMLLSMGANSKTQENISANSKVDTSQEIVGVNEYFSTKHGCDVPTAPMLNRPLQLVVYHYSKLI